MPPEPIWESVLGPAEGAERFRRSIAGAFTINPRMARATGDNANYTPGYIPGRLFEPRLFDRPGIRYSRIESAKREGLDRYSFFTKRVALPAKGPVPDWKGYQGKTWYGEAGAEAVNGFVMPIWAKNEYTGKARHIGWIPNDAPAGRDLASLLGSLESKMAAEDRGKLVPLTFSGMQPSHWYFGQKQYEASITRAFAPTIGEGMGAYFERGKKPFNWKKSWKSLLPYAGAGLVAAYILNDLGQADPLPPANREDSSNQRGFPALSQGSASQHRRLTDFGSARRKGNPVSARVFQPHKAWHFSVDESVDDLPINTGVFPKPPKPPTAAEFWASEIDRPHVPRPKLGPKLGPPSPRPTAVGWQEALAEGPIGILTKAEGRPEFPLPFGISHEHALWGAGAASLGIGLYTLVKDWSTGGKKEQNEQQHATNIEGLRRAKSQYGFNVLGSGPASQHAYTTDFGSGRGVGNPVTAAIAALFSKFSSKSLTGMVETAAEKEGALLGEGMVARTISMNMAGTSVAVKTPHSLGRFAQGQIQQAAENKWAKPTMPAILEMYNKNLTKPAHEAQMLEKLGHIPGIPKFLHYDQESKSIFMEKVVGKIAPESGLKGASEEIKQRAVHQYLETTSEMSKLGFFNKDIHGGNILITPEGHVNLIDLGEVVKATEFERPERHAYSFSSKTISNALGLEEEEVKRHIGTSPFQKIMQPLEDDLFGSTPNPPARTVRAKLPKPKTNKGFRNPDSPIPGINPTNTPDPDDLFDFNSGRHADRQLLKASAKSFVKRPLNSYFYMGKAGLPQTLHSSANNSGIRSIKKRLGNLPNISGRASRPKTHVNKTRAGV